MTAIEQQVIHVENGDDLHLRRSFQRSVRLRSHCAKGHRVAAMCLAALRRIYPPIRVELPYGWRSGLSNIELADAQHLLWQR